MAETTPHTPAPPLPHVPGDPPSGISARQAQVRRAQQVARPVSSRAFVSPVGGVVEGRAYWVDGHLAIADGTVGVGASFHALTGTVEYAKVHEEEWAAGDPIYWYALGGCLSNAEAHESLKVGVADKDAIRPSATGVVRLDTISTP